MLGAGGNAHKTAGITSAAVALVLVGSVAWLLNKPPTGDCSAEAPAHHAVHEIRAINVVVQPWRGKHHVYGIFMVPSHYDHNKRYAVTMAVRGFDHRVTVDEPERHHLGDGPAEQGHYLLSSYLQTRVALWFLVNGLFGDLRDPCNWTLVFAER